MRCARVLIMIGPFGCETAVIAASRRPSSKTMVQSAPPVETLLLSE
jgi:hypothetical protein